MGVKSDYIRNWTISIRLLFWMGSYWMRKARRGQLENAGHFSVLVACGLRSPIALSEQESQRVVVQVIDALRLRRLQEAIVARPVLCRFSYPSIFRAKIVLQSSFFFPTAVLGVAFSSLRREHLRDLLRSQFFCFRSAFAGALLSFLLFYLSSRVMFFSLPRRGEFLSMVWKFVFLWIAWREGFGFAPSVFP